MSAWAQIVNHDGSDEWLELCSEALKEIQQETERRLLMKVAEQRGCWCGHKKEAHGTIDMYPVCLHCTSKQNRHKLAPIKEEA